MAEESLGDWKLPFGIHKGERLADVPIGYLDNLLDWEGLWAGTKEKIQKFLDTQAEYQKPPEDWKTGREDYNPEEDDD